MDSILTSIKKMLGIAEDYEHFDPDIIMHINSTFMILSQIGVGPVDGFTISDKSAIWYNYLSGNQMLEPVKTYVYLRVRILFDPPTSSIVMESMNRMIAELEWRLQTEAEQNRSRTK